MTDRPARRLLRTLRIVAFVLIAATVVWHFFAPEVPWLTRAGALVERALILGLTGFFGLVLLAFVLQFFSDLIHGGDDHVGQVVLRLRHPRGVGAIVLPLLTVWLVFGVGSLAFLPEETLSDMNLQNPFADMTLEFKAVTALFAGIGLFLIVAFTTRAVRNQPWFVLGSLGFVYRPGDVSAGVIRWSDVREIRAGEVLSSAGNLGPTLRPTLVVTLKHPQRHTERYTPLLRLLVRTLTPVLRAQTDGGDVYLDPADFGEEYERVVALMREHAGLAPAAD